MYWPPGYTPPKRYEAIPLRRAAKRQYGKGHQEGHPKSSGASEEKG